MFLTNTSILVYGTGLIPGLSNHDIVLSDGTLRPARMKLPSCTEYIWAKVNLNKLKYDVKSFTRKLFEEDSPCKSVKETWSHIQKFF